MQDTFATLASAAVERTLAFPGRFLENPLRAAALEWLRRRNAALDGAFYDVQVISDAETTRLAPWLAHEGAVVVTPPPGAGDLRVYEDLDAYVASDDWGAVRTLAVAGVGSSALGAAALARNIAEARGEAVAAVVSGYGFADLPTEALGGWLLFGGLNSLRHAFEGLDAVSRLFATNLAAMELTDGVGLARVSKDTTTLAAILARSDAGVDLLVGHSKGNLVISEALYGLKDREAARFKALTHACRVVTLCAKIDMPNGFRVIDVVGEYDLFGAMNSRPDIWSDVVVPHAWHSTNREFPFHLGLDVVAAMGEALAQLAQPPQNQPAPAPSPVPDLRKIAVRLLPMTAPA